MSYNVWKTARTAPAESVPAESVPELSPPEDGASLEQEVPA